MGLRGEVFSTKVQLQNRTYFFNVKENRLGDLYLNIVESKNRDEGGFERQSVILFAEDLQEFLRGFDESLKVLEKSSREKRRGRKPWEGKPADFQPRDEAQREDGPREKSFMGRPPRDGMHRDRPPRSENFGGRTFRDRPPRERRPGFSQGNAGFRPRREDGERKFRSPERGFSGRGGSGRPFERKSRDGYRDSRPEDRREGSRPVRKKRIVVRKK